MLTIEIYDELQNQNMHLLSCPEQLTLSLTDSLTEGTFTFDIQRMILETLIRVMRRHDQTKKDLPTYLPTYLSTSIKELSPRLFTFETFDQSDEET